MIVKKSDRCKTCRRRLSGELAHIGFCEECIVKEIVNIKKRLRISAMIGAVVTATVFAAIYYAKSNAFEFEGDMFIAVPFGHLIYNTRSFNSMTSLSVSAHILLALACFLAPFGSRVRLDFDTQRSKAEVDIYKSDPISGRMAAGSSAHRTDVAGMFIFEIMVSAVSGPFFFVYRIYKLRQLTNYSKTA